MFPKAKHYSTNLLWGKAIDMHVFDSNGPGLVGKQAKMTTRVGTAMLRPLWLQMSLTLFLV